MLGISRLDQGPARIGVSARGALLAAVTPASPASLMPILRSRIGGARRNPAAKGASRFGACVSKRASIAEASLIS